MSYRPKVLHQDMKSEDVKVSHEPDQGNHLPPDVQNVSPAAVSAVAFVAPLLLFSVTRLYVDSD